MGLGGARVWGSSFIPSFLPSLPPSLPFSLSLLGWPPVSIDSTVYFAKAGVSPGFSHWLRGNQHNPSVLIFSCRRAGRFATGPLGKPVDAVVIADDSAVLAVLANVQDISNKKGNCLLISNLSLSQRRLCCTMGAQAEPNPARSELKAL